MKNLTDKEIYRPINFNWPLIMCVIAVIMIAASMNFFTRYNQFVVWSKNETQFQLNDGSLLFTTTDAPSFLMRAKLIKDREDTRNFETFRSYPTNLKIENQKSEAIPLRDIELLPIVLAYISAGSDNKSLLHAGNMMLIWTSVISTLMVIVGFGASGNWLFGAIAGAGGGLTQSYLSRSSIGRIDNDQLNMGFFYLILGLIIFSARAKSQKASTILAIISGCTLWVFDWWHSQPIFTYFFISAFIWLELLINKNIKRLLINLLILIILSGSINITNLFSDVYFDEQLLTGSLMFPNAFTTITEARPIRFLDITLQLAGSSWLFGFGILGLLFWLTRQPILGLTYMPILLFIFASFVYGSRVLYYSGPIIWFGISYSVFFIVRLIKVAFQNSNKFKDGIEIILVGSISLFLVSFYSNLKIIYKPTFDRDVVQGLANIKNFESIKDKVVVTWWDYGYASIFFNNAPVLHDGGTQTTPITFFVAKSLLDNSQKKASAYQRFLINDGLKGVINNSSSAATLEKVILSKPSKLDEVDGYLFLSKDLAKWMPSIASLGLWDIENNSPIIKSGIAPNRLQYLELSCSATSAREILNCNGQELNLASGLLNGKPVIKRLIVSENGYYAGARSFNKSSSSYVVQIIKQKNKKTIIYLIPEILYNSVFHQLFYLGKADKKSFVLVEDGFPAYRIFKIQ